VSQLDRVYAQRFDDPALRDKERFWPVIARYLQRWVDPDSPVLEIACDGGYLIRNVHAAERWASDVRDVSASIPVPVRFVQARGLELGEVLPAGYFGTVLMSNYLEHLRSGDQVVDQLRVVAELLRPGGRVIVLQPNIRLTGAAYWDFIDHGVALTDKSLAEAARAAGLATERVIVRFLPYTTKSRIPRHPALVWLYLRFRPAWWIMGRQTLYVGRRG
jgi:2-polyprenyl-3-methyl-5-hydroxy-6-metoxy-1,4-benzoquinol methylase